MKTLLTSFVIFTISISASNAADRLSWEELPPLPNKSGVAGPFAGTHNDALIVAGGANFPQPVWENDKAWHDEIFVLTKAGDEFVWKDGGRLVRPSAYGAAVSTPDGVICMGGNDAESTFDDVFLLSWDASAQVITTTKYPSLPEPCAYGAATLVGDVIYLAGGQNGQSLETAMKNFWALDLSKKGNPDEFVWQKLPAWPGPSRALNLTVSQHNRTHDCVYVISGRRQENEAPASVEFLKDVWEYTLETREWRKRADAPRCVMAGTAIGHGRNQILVLGGADGSLFFMGDELKDEHPGFPKKALTYDTVDDRWSEAGTTPRNHVTTIVVEWDGAIIVPSGEVRPRVRSPKVWRVTSPVVADVEKTDLFEADKEGYALYRIPGIVVTKQGTVLAYCEARKSDRSDWGPIDVLMRRSMDGGKTWLPRQKIVHVEGDLPVNPLAVAQNLDKPGDNTVNNPVAIVDHESGAVHFLYCLEYMRCFYMRSDDDGATWTEPVEITKTFEDFRTDYDWKVLATGPSHAIQLTHGSKQGRLVVPVWLSLGTGGHAHRPSVTATIYSDDHGKTWQRGEIAVPDTPEFIFPNETVVVQLADGSVMLNTRSESKQHRRIVTISPDGATNWSKPRFDQQLLEPICMAGMVRVRDGVIAFSNPHNLSGSQTPGKSRGRKNVSIKLSDDEGKTWSASRTLEPGFSGYSDLAVLPDGTILCFYERGSTDGKSIYRTGRLTVARVTEDWVRDDEADVCVYGGTSGGVVAAVQAARMGKRVVLVEPGRHLGGMMAGGLSWSDVGSAERAKLFGGLAREVFQRIGKHYGQDPEKVFEIAATKIEGRSTGGVDFIRPPSLAFEPMVAERAFNELVREAGVKVLLESGARKVVKDGKRIVRIELEDGGAVTAKMFIDATYEGDLMALAGVSYTVGRESNEQYNETMNGVRGPEHGPSSGRFPVKVDPFVKAGDPSSGLLPLIAGGAPEPLGSADKRIQSYNFRLCLTDDPANRAPLEPPADYDPAQWELLGRYVVAMTQSGRKLTLRSFCKYDPLPNRKFDFNNRWPISTDMLGGAHGWPEGTANDRARIAKAHEDYLRGLFHFLRTDPRVPANVREETARFGLPKDEFTDNGNWPHQIYVREARRMVSDFVMTEHHIRNREVAPNGISLATYPMDIHAVRRVYHEGKLYNEGFGGGGGRPAPIGYGAIVPKAAECENLFVTFALSASHAAFGSIRMEPVFMVSSQSAATAACLAIDADTSVHDVDQAKLRARLLANGQILAASSTPAAASNPKIVKADRLPGIVMDDDKAEYQGHWMLSNAQPTPIGGYYRHDGNTDRGKKSATFTATVPKAGDYEIRFLYSPHDNRSTKTKVTVTGAGEEKTFRINQREPVIKDGVPNALGVFRIEVGAKVRVTVSNEGADSYVVVDGLQILPVEIAREERAGKRPSGYAMSEPSAQSAPSAAPRRKPLKVKPVRSSSAAEVRGKTYDVVVIGGTPGGIACAVRAAREGLTVLLVQHNRHIGGMLTSGLMQWDALYGGPRSPLFNEYAKSIEGYYRETYGPDSPQFQKARYTQQHYPMSLFECGVAEHLFNQLVSAESNIITLLSHYPAEIQREGAALKALTLREYGTQNDIAVTGVTYVDATYEGDLAALAKVPYRVGREGRDEYDEPHAGKLFTNISKEAGSQDAKAGKLNLRLYGHSQGTVDPKSPRSADSAVQAYNYRFSLSNEPGNIRLPKKPPGYKREEYVDYYRRFMGAGRLNGKASFNAAILPGENHAYPESTWPEREKIIERHKNFSLGLMWFLQNDESVRPESREHYRSIGLPLDEFPDNDNIPYEMYVREARRIVGRHVFTEHDNRAAPGRTRPPMHADSIAFTDWAMDSHDCTGDRSSGYAYDGKLILTEQSRPAQIPWRSLLPQGVDNLIVPVCMSTTHVAWGAVRLEPVWMMTGEAAGLAAALARRQAVTPGQLDADLLQRALCEKRHFVNFFNDLETAADHPAMPAAQYFAARGFFPDYNARLDEPLTESVNRIWGEGLSALREGSLDAMALATKVKQAEAADSLKLERTRGDAMLSMWRAVSGVHRRAAFVEEPRIFIRHGERRRRFIGPHAIELPNGDLLMSAPWGRPPADIAEEIVANHPVPDLYRSKDRGRTWTNAGRLPVKWEHRGFVSDGGVSFLRLADGRLALLLHRHIRGFKGGGLPAICFSSDDGQTWTDPTLLAGPEDEGVWYVMNDRLAQTRSGRLLVPVARAVGKFEGDRDESLVFYSDDAGKTWKSSEPAPLPDGPRGMAEPCVIELKDGRLLMMARGGLGVLLASHSEDGGLTWSRGSPTTLTSPLSSFTLRRLPDGRLIVFYNHAAPSRPGGAFPRCPLAYAVSADEGKTWSEPFVIDDEGLKPASGELPDMAHVYPGITFLEEGMLVLYSSHMTRNRFGYRTGDVPWKPEQLARTGGKVALLAYPPEKLPYPPAKPAGIVLDDDEAECIGAWKVGERLTPLVGFSYRHDDRPSKLPAVAKFTPEIPVAGKYEVRLLYISNPNRAQNVPITIRSADGERTLTQNQRTPCLVNGVPRSLGVFEFAKGKSGSIEISNKGADGYVIIDGLQLVLEDTANAERANGEDAGFPLKTVAATGPVKIPPPMLLNTAAKPEQVDGKSYDLVVIGGTPGGIACAVRAAREGLNVLLVNHTQHIGGFMTSGAGGWEAPYDGLRSPIYGEMLTSAAAYYRDTYGEGSPQHLASMPSQTSRRHLDRPKIEPRIAELLFNRMVEKEKMLTVLLGHIVTKAERDGTLLKSVTLQPMHGEDRVTVRGKVFADAMYEGDLMAAAGVNTQIGRESREQYSEPHAGVIYTKKRRLEPGRRGYPEVADKGALNIRYNPTSTAAIVEGPHSGEADDSVMAYNYRLILTRDPANRIMVARPANFDLALAKAASGGGFVPNLPNRKVAWNGGRLVGPQNGYPNGDWPTREAISRRYLDAMLMRLWWMQNDPAAPKRFRDQFGGYGLAADEFPDNNHVPYEIYVREARRLVGRYVFKEQDNIIADGIARTPIHRDSIAITDWPMDSVACLPRNAPDGGTDGILFLSEESRPAQVPYRSLLPVELDNLLVPVALSASHVGWGSIRLEPVWMQTGEAAGFAAALAVKEQTTPAALNPDTLIRKLAASRVMIAFFNDMDAASNDPDIPAAQYFATRGFFHSYDAALHEPLTEATAKVWRQGFAELQSGNLDPRDLAARVAKAAADTDSLPTEQSRGEEILRMWKLLSAKRKPSK